MNHGVVPPRPAVFGRLSRQTVNRVTVLLLAAGLGGALLLALLLPPEEPNPLGDPMDSSKYLHDLKAIGGEANVLSAQFQDWFAGLWHGPALARGGRAHSGRDPGLPVPGHASGSGRWTGERKAFGAGSQLSRRDRG